MHSFGGQITAGHKRNKYVHYTTSLCYWQHRACSCGEFWGNGDWGLWIWRHMNMCQFVASVCQQPCHIWRHQPHSGTDCGLCNQTPKTYLKITGFHFARLWFPPSVEDNSTYPYFLPTASDSEH